MKFAQKCIIMSIIISLLLITCSDAANTTTLRNDSAGNTSAANNIKEGTDITKETQINEKNENSNYKGPQKDEISDYLSSIAVEKESVTEFMQKIDGNKLLNAIINQQKSLGNTFLEEDKDNIVKLNIELYDGDNREGAPKISEISCDLQTNNNTTILSSSNNIHTGMSAACGITEKDRKAFGFNLGEVKISVKGDISGQGDIGVVDLSLMQQDLVDEITLENEYYRAADMDSNYNIDVVDMSMLQDYIVNN